MNYQPSSHDFVVENPQAQTFFVNREVFVSDDVFEREKRAIFDRCWIYVGLAGEFVASGAERDIAGTVVTIACGLAGWTAHEAASGRPVRIGTCGCFVFCCLAADAEPLWIAATAPETNRPTARSSASHHLPSMNACVRSRPVSVSFITSFGI